MHGTLHTLGRLSRLVVRGKQAGRGCRLFAQKSGQGSQPVSLKELLGKRAGAAVKQADSHPAWHQMVTVEAVSTPGAFLCCCARDCNQLCMSRLACRSKLSLTKCWPRRTGIQPLSALSVKLSSPSLGRVSTTTSPSSRSRSHSISKSRRLALRQPASARLQRHLRSKLLPRQHAHRLVRAGRQKWGD